MKEEEVQTEELTLFPWRVTTAQVSHIYFVSADRIEKYKLTPTITITFFFFFYRGTFSKDLHSGSSTRREKTERRSSTVDRKMSGTVFQFHHTSHSVTTPTCLLSVSWTHCCHGDGWCHPTAGGGSGVMLRPDRRALIQKTELILFLFCFFFQAKTRTSARFTPKTTVSVASWDDSMHHWTFDSTMWWVSDSPKFKLQT